jgi:hypothetical protein
MSVADYLAYFEDRHAPLVPKPKLQDYDNYQIYSLFCVDYNFSTTLYRATLAYSVYSPGLSSFSTYSNYSLTPSRGYGAGDVTYNEFGHPDRYIAYQRFSVSGKIPINFDRIATKLVVKPHNRYRYKYLFSNYLVRSVEDIRYFYTNQTLPDRSDFYAEVESNNLADSINQFSYLSVDNIRNDAFDFGTYIIRRIRLYKALYRYGNTQYTLLEPTALITGYAADPRVKPPDRPLVTPAVSGQISVNYYRRNPHEPIPNLTSLDWMSYPVDLIKGVPAYLPIIDPVFGTLIFQGDPLVIADVKTKLAAISTSGFYHWNYFYAENIDMIVGEWMTIYNNFPHSNSAPNYSDWLEKDYKIYDTPIVHVIAANNNHWGNDNTNYSDINYDALHPMYNLNEYRVNTWHFEQQTDGSYGDLIMNSPMLEEIHRALNAGKWGVNIDDPTRPRFDNLGWRIERGNQVLGIRVGANGKFDPDKEKQSVKMVISSDTNLEDKEIGITNFAKDGMVLKRINNRFKDGKIVSDECVIVKDFIQLLGEYQDQNNIALGLQESSAIVIAEDDKKAQYHNQLQVLVELLNLANSSNEMLRNLLISSLVTQGQSSEMISALGLPSVTKTIPIKLDGKIADLPYKGVAAHRSISQEIATCTQNVGLVLGQLI